jgi:hypothetical protein
VILLEQLRTGLCEDSHFTAHILFSLSLRKEDSQQPSTSHIYVDDSQSESSGESEIEESELCCVYKVYSAVHFSSLVQTFKCHDNCNDHNRNKYI